MSSFDFFYNIFFQSFMKSKKKSGIFCIKNCLKTLFFISTVSITKMHCKGHLRLSQTGSSLVL